jgi:predicted metal-dependent peptidase
MGTRDPELWNKAADYAINPVILAAGLKLPEGCLNSPAFAGKSAEEIYRALEKEAKDKPSQGNAKPSQGNGPKTQGNGQGNGPSKAPSFGEVLPCKGSPAQAEEKAKIQASKAESIARMAGAMPSELSRLVAKEGAARIDWREVLHRFFQDFTRSDYSFASPNRRFAGGPIVMPSLRSRSIGRVVVAIDTSGSVSESEVCALVAECLACVEAYTAEGLESPLRVIYCDSRVQGDETIGRGDTPHPKGGGGTCFAPVFELLGDDLEGAACLIYLTDGWASDIAALANISPAFPVLWGLIVENESFAPPFGEVFRIDIHS